ncbi:MAG: hypothetical protein LUI07_02740, partial [Lachnospiraceae bacterium]|nr:hypothetical protein [Lachnospiraceae bacterium]
YYTGNIIAKREVISYKTISATFTLNSPGGSTVTVKLKVPKKVKYTLHRHNLSNKTTSTAVGRAMYGIVNKKIVWTQTCSCGLENVMEWTIPDASKLISGKTYTVKSTSSGK